jgi:hypothetical protein
MIKNIKKIEKYTCSICEGTIRSASKTKYKLAICSKCKEEETFNILIYSFTKTKPREINDLINETPKDLDWRQILLKKSYNYMLELAKSMSPYEMEYTLNKGTTLIKVLDKFRHVLLEERENRKRQDRHKKLF